MAYIQEADWAACTRCGQCLMRCPVLKMEAGEARNAIQGLIRGEYVPRVFDECTYCFNCNRYCPVEGLRPHELILQRTIEYRKGVPAIFNYLSNGRNTPNLFQDMYHALDPEENHILDQWSETPAPAKEILWIGCIGKLSCLDIHRSTVLADLPKFGPKDLCCGELAYRLGSWEMYARTIDRVLERFQELDIDRMVCYCGSCYNYFSNILPNVYGRKLPFKLISMYQWMWEKIEKGELTLSQPLQFRAAIHESCYVSELEPDFAHTLRRIYAAAGMDIVELAHNGDENLSCGAVSVIRSMNLWKSMVREQRKKYHEAKLARTNEIAVNCPGCYVTMAFTHRFFNKGLRYMPEELLAAYGDTISRPLKKRLPLFVTSFAARTPQMVVDGFKKIGVPQAPHLSS